MDTNALTQLHDLLSKEILSQKEFDEQKKRLLSEDSQTFDIDVEQLEKLYDLFKKQAINQTEFSQQKQLVLSGKELSRKEAPVQKANSDVEQRLNMFILSNSKKFNFASIELIKNKVKTDPKKLETLMYSDFKDPDILLIVSIGAGFLGVDRFMLGQAGFGVLKILLNLFFFFIPFIIDLFLIRGATRKVNDEQVLQRLI